MTAKLKSKLKIQFFVFVLLFIAVEILLRCFGMRAGGLIDDFIMEDSPIYQPRFESDEMGVNHILPKKEMLILGSVINKQGFRGKIDYTPVVIDSIRKSSQKEIVMIIGDSYVEGCCPDSVGNSFPDIINENSRYQVLNFGVAGTDPVQYELVAKKYVRELMPDKVVVVFYFGNDILYFKREPSPGTPLTYPFKKNKWIFAVAPNHLSGKMNYNFKNPEEAYQFYVDHYTLEGTKRNVFEKLLSYSVVFSKIYLLAEHQLAKRAWQKKNVGLKIDENEIAYSNLRNIRSICDSLRIPAVFVGIPAPSEAEEGSDLKNKYQKIFKDIPWFVPENLNESDYDGLSKANHFNNKGHAKYAIFLEQIIKHTKVRTH